MGPVKGQERLVMLEVPEATESNRRRETLTIVTPTPLRPRASSSPKRSDISIVEGVVLHNH